MERPLAAIILAAGLGTRMRSTRAKVLHQLAGEPMIARTLRAFASVRPGAGVVRVGFGADEVRDAARRALPGATDLVFAAQPRQRGTGDAARCGLDALADEFAGDVLIGYGDMPRLSPATLRAFVAEHRRRGAKLSFISVKVAGPNAYGRVVRDEAGAVRAIVEARDATPAERAIDEINTGVYLADAALLREALAELRPENAQREYYLTDIVAIGSDTVIGPNVQIMGRSRIGAGVTIEGTAWLRDVVVGDRCHLKLGVRAEECIIGEECDIGPFANLRTGTELEGHNRIGNFVETKKARIGRGTKASHLSYLGDTVIGRETNVGCGVITVNYDGYDKHETRIGDRCMVGCDTQLIAPVKVGDDVHERRGGRCARHVASSAAREGRMDCAMAQTSREPSQGSWQLAWRRRRLKYSRWGERITISRHAEPTERHGRNNRIP